MCQISKQWNNVLAFMAVFETVQKPNFMGLHVGTQKLSKQIYCSKLVHGLLKVKVISTIKKAGSMEL